MEESNVISLKDPFKISDPLTELLRTGARQLLHQAVEAELEEFLSGYSDEVDDGGRRQVVRNGYLPSRTIQTGIGDVDIQVPRVRDRLGRGLTFKSSLLPPYLRRSRSIEELLPYLYLKGISTGDFSDALRSLLGDEAPGLSAGTICRLKDVWQEEYEQWSKRDLSLKRYVYVWVDGVYIHAKNDSKQCLLVMIGANKLGKKEVVAIHDGYRESTQSWRELLLDLKQRGLSNPPELSIGDGAMGYWSAMKEIFPDTQEQRCWVHKTANVLNRFPKSMQEKVKQHIHDIWMAEDKESANKAFGYFIQCYQDKYPKAVHCLEKDRQQLLTFYDFPARHWQSIRSTNVIESVFATVKHRTYKAKGCLSRKTALTMVFKLIIAAQNRWIALQHGHQCAEIINGIKFKNGVKLCNNNTTKQNQQNAA